MSFAGFCETCGVPYYESERLNHKHTPAAPTEAPAQEPNMNDPRYCGACKHIHPPHEVDCRCYCDKVNCPECGPRIAERVLAAPQTESAGKPDLNEVKDFWLKYYKADPDFLPSEAACQFALAYSAKLRAEIEQTQEKWNESESYIKSLPANWYEDSSLETWFPLTAEELKRVKSELSAAESSVTRLTRERDDARKILADYVETWKAAHPHGKCSRPAQCLVCRSKAALAHPANAEKEK